MLLEQTHPRNCIKVLKRAELTQHLTLHFHTDSFERRKRICKSMQVCLTNKHNHFLSVRSIWLVIWVKEFSHVATCLKLHTVYYIQCKKSAVTLNEVRLTSFFGGMKLLHVICMSSVALYITSYISRIIRLILDFDL